MAVRAGFRNQDSGFRIQGKLRVLISGGAAAFPIKDIPIKGISIESIAACRHSAAQWPQPKPDSLRPPCLSSSNSEHKQRLSDLSVEVLLATEDTEAPTTRGEIFAARQEADCYRYRSLPDVSP